MMLIVDSKDVNVDTHEDEPIARPSFVRMMVADIGVVLDRIKKNSRSHVMGLYFMVTAAAVVVVVEVEVEVEAEVVVEVVAVA